MSIDQNVRAFLRVCQTLDLDPVAAIPSFDFEAGTWDCNPDAIARTRNAAAGTAARDHQREGTHTGDQHEV
jgi:hypothetical protein